MRPAVFFAHLIVSASTTPAPPAAPPPAPTPLVPHVTVSEGAVVTTGLDVDGPTGPEAAAEWGVSTAKKIALVDGTLGNWRSAPNGASSAAGTDTEPGPGTLFVELDLGAETHIEQVVVWMYYGDERRYCCQTLAVGGWGAGFRVHCCPQLIVLG